MHRWQDAHVGRESPQMAVRVTEAEKDRLEELRQELRLTSKGQVIRAALDLLERAALGVDVFTGEDRQETKRIFRRARRAAGVPRVRDLKTAPADDAVAWNKDLRTSYKHVVSKPDAEDGSPGPAPAADPSQLQLPGTEEKL